MALAERFHPPPHIFPKEPDRDVAKEPVSSEHCLETIYSLGRFGHCRIKFIVTMMGNAKDAGIFLA